MRRTKCPPSEVALRLKSLRELAGIDPEGLSNAAGLAKTHVYLIEVGWIETPKIDTLMALSEALGVSFEYLCTGKGGDPPSRKKIRAAFRKAQESA